MRVAQKYTATLNNSLQFTKWAWAIGPHSTRSQNVDKSQNVTKIIERDRPNEMSIECERFIHRESEN